MEDRLRNHVEEIFKETTPTKKTVELKEEMIQNLTEKYSDLTGEGKTPEAAYNIAVAGIGDISELLKDLEDEIRKPEITARQRQRSAMYTAIAIMLYILSVLPLIILDQIFQTHASDVIGVSIVFIFIAVATGLLIYNGMTKPKYVRGNDTVVEEFRQWKSGKAERKTLRGSISVALWSIIVVLYFIISFASESWYITWIIFIIGGAIEAIINIAFSFKN